MGQRGASYIDYQQRAEEFAVGDYVFHVQESSDHIGTVTAVYPGIGMADVQFFSGSIRLPVEDLQRYERKDVIPPDPDHDTVPGGAGTVRVPGGPKRARKERLDRIAHVFVKKSLYWGARDRRYRATRPEIESGVYTCPKCKEHTLRPATYKRRDGESVKLLGCQGCLFLIKSCDIIGSLDYEDAQPRDLFSEHKVARVVQIIDGQQLKAIAKNVSKWLPGGVYFDQDGDPQVVTRRGVTVFKPKGQGKFLVDDRSRFNWAALAPNLGIRPTVEAV